MINATLSHPFVAKRLQVVNHHDHIPEHVPKTSQVFNLVTTNMSLSENEVTKNFMVHHCFPHERSYLFGGLPWFTSFSDHHAYVSARLPPPGCRNPFSLWVKFMGLSMMRMEIEWIYEGISYFNATHHNSSSYPDLIFPTSFSHHHAPGTTVPQRAARSCSNIHREHRPAHGSWSTLSWHPSRQETTATLEPTSAGNGYG